MSWHQHRLQGPGLAVRRGRAGLCLSVSLLAEMAPGVSEYNAVREGDWQGFCIAAGIDVAAISAGILLKNGKSAAAVKQGGEAVARKGLKKALSEIAETGVRETA